MEPRSPNASLRLRTEPRSPFLQMEPRPPISGVVNGAPLSVVVGAPLSAVVFGASLSSFCGALLLAVEPRSPRRGAPSFVVVSERSLALRLSGASLSSVEPRPPVWSLALHCGASLSVLRSLALRFQWSSSSRGSLLSRFLCAPAAMRDVPCKPCNRFLKRVCFILKGV